MINNRNKMSLHVWPPNITSLAGIIVILTLGSCAEDPVATTDLPPDKPIISSGSAIVVIGVETSFSSLASEPEGANVIIWFYWGDGDSTLAGPGASEDTLSAVHAYLILGSYRLHTVAVDPAGNRSVNSDDLRISVLEPGPQAPSRPAGPDSVALNMIYTYSSSSISASGGNLQLMFNWGDNESTFTAWDTSGATFYAPHIFYDTGLHFVRAVALDDSGRTSGLSLATPVTAWNNPPLTPNAPFGDSSAVVNEIVTFYGTAIDPDGDDVSMEFHWGDGTSTVTPVQSVQDFFIATHQYQDIGSFAVRLSATDIYGGVSDTSLGALINIPIFPIVEVTLTSTGILNNPALIAPGWRIKWINQDAISHVIEPDSAGAFVGGLIKSGLSLTETFPTLGTFGYHSRDFPLDTRYQGKIIVR